MIRKVELPQNYQPMTIRQQLNHWLIPRKWQHYLRVEENIVVNGVYKSFNQQLEPGDQLILNFLHVDSHQQVYTPSDDHHLKIRYEDEDIIVVDKPTDMKTHPNQPWEDNTLINVVAGYLEKTQQQPYIVHRLDMLTSGLILFAKNPLVVPILNREISQKLIQRQYLAVVKRNNRLAKSGDINLPIGQDPADKRKRKVDPTGLPAATHYEVLSTDGKYSLLKLTLGSGRTHQIRVHLAAIGTPILGDPLYNPTSRAKRLALHAYKMKIPLPFSDQKITVQTSLPTFMAQYLDA